MTKYRIETDKGAYEVEVDDSQQQSPMPETGLNRTANAITGAMQAINMGSGYKGPVETMEPQGQNLFNRAGEATAEYLGGKNIPGNPYTAAAAGTAISMANPQNWMVPLKEGPAMVPGQGIAQGVAQDLGRRSLGINKGMLNRMKGGVPRANQAAQEMLDQGVIKPFSGAKSTLERAESVADISGQAVGKALKSTGQNALDASQVSNEIINQLAPDFKGGAYLGQENVANEILDTVNAHGNGPIDFDSAQKLKNTLKQQAGNNWNTDKIKASMYQRAYGIVSDAMERAVEEANPAGASGYIRNKKTYGASQIAIKGLEDKANAEASSSLVSLRGAAIGAGALASGHVTPALEALGVWEGARRVGSATGSYFANKLASPVSENIRRAALASFITKVTSGKQ